MGQQLNSSSCFELGFELVDVVGRLMLSNTLTLPCELLVTGSDDELLLHGNIDSDCEDVIGAKISRLDDARTKPELPIAYPVIVSLTDSSGITHKLTFHHRKSS